MGKSVNKKNLAKSNTENNKPSASVAKDKNHYVVGIGASAGGLEAIHEFFDNVPSENDLSFVLIQHLSPDYKSLMAELLAKHTTMEVHDAKEGMQVKKNSVYVIPNKKNLIIKDGKLRLIEKARSQSPNTAIDIFFESLAEEMGQNSIAIILSGTGTDGTKGIEKIHNKGGLVISQDPLTAKFDGMPNSAINSGNVDYVLPPELMFEEIITHIKQGPVDNKILEMTSRENESILIEILDLIRNHTSYDFTYYKRPTIHRRIIRRMLFNEVKNVNDYLEFLYSNPGEIHQLCKEFLIGVTKFFRDAEAWDVLKKKVISELVHKKNFSDPLKVWVAGCSTGEEAYSIAILIKEELDKHRKELNVKIFATDIDKEALEHAAKGLYSEAIAHDIPAKILDKYFVKEGNKFQIDPHIRKMVIFANHDLTKDPPFSKIDLVTCRNLLIYLNPVLQKKVINTFHFAMNVGAYLFLGSSETVGENKIYLEDVDKKWKVYRNIQASRGAGYDNMSLGFNLQNIVTGSRTNKSQIQNNFTEVFNDSLLEEFCCAGVYIDMNYELLHAVGDFNKFIQLPDKKLNLNLLKMVPEEMAILLGAALRKAAKQNEKVVLKRLKSGDKKNAKLIDIIVKPYLEGNKQPSRFILVIFKEVDNQKISKGKKPDFSSLKDSSRVKNLEFELRETKENLQAAIEELETSNEELQSANEELLSANEELQSTNEELQSLNEELHTVNSEHQLKIKELIELNDDLNNFFRTSDIGQIFVDKNLLIRKYTPAVTKQINLIETDIGRPISHISNNIRFDKMVQEIKEVITSKESFEKEIQLEDNKWFFMKISPYIRQDKRVDGAVVSFVDITKIRDLNGVLSGVLDSALNIIMAFKAVRNSSHKIVDFEWSLSNKFSENIIGKKNLIGKRFFDEMSGNKKTLLFEKFAEVVESGKPVHMEEYLEFDKYKGYFNIVAVKMDDGFTVTFTDITSQRTAEDKLKALNADLEKAVNERTKELKISEEHLKSTNDNLRKINIDLDNFIYTASHDLRAPISNIEGLVEALSAGIDNKNEEMKEIVDLMRISVEKFKDTIKDLTEISRIQKEQFEDIEEINVKELLDEINVGLKEMIDKSKASISIDLEKPTIKFSKKNLRSIFYNLVTNAIKYRSPQRTPEIKIKTQQVDGYALFSIQDNGLGIPERHQNKIFSMFKRFHDHVDGTGVGLYIVKRIVDNSGGMIKVDSEEGRGTQFKVYFKDKGVKAD
ncbi:MAG: PAS domain-containing protein [Cytophagaceae bacterium]|nr:PAS domain-containing protein [Cytophagaceae bacterium]